MADRDRKQWNSKHKCIFQASCLGSERSRWRRPAVHSCASRCTFLLQGILQAFVLRPPRPPVSLFTLISSAVDPSRPLAPWVAVSIHSEISQQLLDGEPRSAQTFVLPQWWILMTYPLPMTTVRFVGLGHLSQRLLCWIAPKVEAPNPRIKSLWSVRCCFRYTSCAPIGCAAFWVFCCWELPLELFNRKTVLSYPDPTMSGEPVIKCDLLFCGPVKRVWSSGRYRIRRAVYFREGITGHFPFKIWQSEVKRALIAVNACDSSAAGCAHVSNKSNEQPVYTVNTVLAE